MTDHIVTYTCKLGATHAIPSDDVRVLKTGDGSFLAACACSPEPLAESHERPHESEEHFSYIDGREIPAEDWVALEEVADGWYDVDPAKSPDGDDDTRRERREQFARAMYDRADESPPMFDSKAEQRRHQAARNVACPVPDCGASPGCKCVRPSGHRVRKCHADRRDAARDAGYLPVDGDGQGGSDQGQAELSAFA